MASSLPRRPRSRLDQLGQASPVGPVPWELAELPESAEFARWSPITQSLPGGTVMLNGVLDGALPG